MENFDEDDEWNQTSDADEDQGYQALLDPDDETASFNEQDDENLDDELPATDDADEEEQSHAEDSFQDNHEYDDGLEKLFSCSLCSFSFNKFENYREHFASVEHRYKRRDEKRRLGDGANIETTPCEVFVNILLYNKIPFETVQLEVEPIDFSFNGFLEYKTVKYEHKHGSSLNEVYQSLVDQFNKEIERHQLKMPPPSFFVARDVCRKEIDQLWTITREVDDTGKSDEIIIKELLDFCVHTAIQPERERLIGHAIQTWRMFHRQEAKAGFWCDICKQCFRKRKAILCHFENSEKHQNNLKHLPPYRRAVQHSLFTGRPLAEFVEQNQLNYYRTRVNAYRLPPSNPNIKNAYYCTFCKKFFESAYSLEKHFFWKTHREAIKTRRQKDLDNIPRLVTYLNFNMLNPEQRKCGIQQMPKAPNEYQMKYNIQPITIEFIQDDIARFDSQLAQQVMQNMQQPMNNVHRSQRGTPNRGRPNRGRAQFRGHSSFPQPMNFRPRAHYHLQYGHNQNHSPHFHPRAQRMQQHFQQYPNQGNQFFSRPSFPGPSSFRPQNENFSHGPNKRPYSQAYGNQYNQRQMFPNKRARFERPPFFQQPPPPNRIDYRYVANQNGYSNQQQ